MLFLLFALILLFKSIEGDPIPTPKAYPISVSTKMMDKTGDLICDPIISYCPQENFEDPLTYSCEQLCWSYNGNATFSYTFKGIQFMIYGRHNQTGRFNLFIDNENLGEITEIQSDEKVADLLYTSSIYMYGSHTIRAVGQKGQYFEIFKFAFWPDFNAKRLNVSDMLTSGKWLKKSDEIGGTGEYCLKDSSSQKTFIIEMSKLWIYGASDPSYGKLQIKLNTHDYIIDTKDIHQDYKLLFESEEMSSSFNMVDLISIEAESVLLYCIYYIGDQTKKTNQKYPYKSIKIFEESNQNFINKSFIKNLPENKQIHVHSDSSVTHISDCTFSDIKLSDWYFIKLDKEISFVGNRFEFSTFDDYPTPIYLDSILHGKMIISHCTFIKCKSKQYSGNVLICNCEADVTIEKCKFINCGNDESQTIVKSHSSQKHFVNFTDCTFMFDNENLSCCAIETESSVNVIFNSCTFLKCPVSKIQLSIGFFQFTNNYVASANKQIILIYNLKYKANISSNKFLNSALVGSKYIKITHDVNEITLFNNTFSGFISKGNKISYSILYLQRYRKLKNNLIINECKFINNHNNYSVIQIGYSLFPANIAVKIINSQFYDNICNKENGGALTISVNYELIIKNCTFKNNKAYNNGGALALYQIRKIKIISCTFVENIANYVSSASIHGLKHEGCGGAIYIKSSFHLFNSDKRIENCTFALNSAFNGYAIYIEGDDDGKKIIIDNNIFNKNYDKGTNLFSKGVFTSKILHISKDKIIYSNKLIQNAYRLIQYTDNNGNVLIPDSTFENNSYIYYILLKLFVSIAFIFIIVRKLTYNEQNDTFIFVILGDNAQQYSESNNKNNSKKYVNYCFASNALLIKRLAINYLGINEQHVYIFVKGEEEVFDISSIVPNNRIVTQITIDEIYDTEPLQSELKYKPFRNVSELIMSIRSLLYISKCENPNIILFIFNSNLKFLEFYLGLMKIPHSSLHIYNESCKSNSMILAIKKYFDIRKAISSFTTKITTKELLFLASVGNEIYPRGSFVQWEAIKSLDNKYNCVYKKNDQTFDYLCSIVQEGANPSLLYNQLSSSFSTNDIDSLVKIINCYISIYQNHIDYERIHSIFKKTKIIQKALKQLNCTNAKFLNLVSKLNQNKKDFADIPFKMHKNHSIVTSSHECGYSPTFGTIRINENQKLIAGSPTMGAYIIEVLMKRSLCKSSINDIQKIVYGNHVNMIYEYSTSSIQVKKKNWVRLNINYWESKQFSHKKILYKQDCKKTKINIGYLMNLIGFRLISRCNIQFNAQYNCITRKMQPLYRSKRKQNYIGIRLAYLDQNYDYSQSTTDDDSYYNEYSDGSTNCNTTLDKLGSSNVTPSSSFEKLFDDMDYDIIISQEYLAKIRKEVKLDDLLTYQLRFLAVFKHELNKIKKSKKFIENYKCTIHEVPKKVPSGIKSNMYDWIRHFFPPYILQEELNNFCILFYAFMLNYNVPEKNAKDIFYKCMNIADQVASQSSNADKKAAYYVNRLNFFLNKMLSL